MIFCENHPTYYILQRKHDGFIPLKQVKINYKLKLNLFFIKVEIFN